MKLSIITVNYNNRDGLKKTIDSVICQTWRDFEWIVIDGGSTDGSRELIERYQNYFAFWCSEPDKGVYDAMNKGIAKAQGEYLNFMNSGDCFFDGNTLGNIFKVDIIEDVVYGDWDELDGKGVRHVVSPNDATIDFFYRSNICHQAIFVRSCLMKLKGYDETFQVYADWAYWLNLAVGGATFRRLPLIVCVYDIRDGLSRRNPLLLNEEFQRMRSLIPFQIMKILEKNDYLSFELKRLREHPFIKDGILLYRERPLFRRLIHLSLFMMQSLSTVLKVLKV